MRAGHSGRRGDCALANRLDQRYESVQRPVRDRPQESHRIRQVNGRRGEQGSAVVEFALILPVVVLVLLAVVEVTVVARTQYELVHAAREGARTAATVADPSPAVRAVQAAPDPAGAGPGEGGRAPR